MKKIISTLRALVEVMEALSKDADPTSVGGLITEEVLLLHNLKMFIMKINLADFSAVQDTV